MAKLYDTLIAYLIQNATLMKINISNDMFRVLNSLSICYANILFIEELAPFLRHI